MEILLRFSNQIALLGISFVAAVLIVAVHEYAHAFTSWRMGDRLPKFNRRLTLNPLSHIDIPGILFFVYTGFGWSNPTETSPRNYKDKKKGSMLVGFAGPLASLALAAVGCLAWKYIEVSTILGSFPLSGYAGAYVEQFVRDIYHFSFNLALLSLLPLPIFDGFLIWSKVISPKNQFYIYQYQNFALTMLLLVFLILPESLEMLISPIRAVFELSAYGIVRLFL